MSRKKSTGTPSADSQAAPSPWRSNTCLLLLIAGLVLLTVLAVYWVRPRPAEPAAPRETSDEAQPARTTPPEASRTAPDPEADATAPRPRPAEYATLKGRWLRTDGDYVIAVEDVTLNGTVKAAYYNPTAIHVSEARATKEGDRLELFVELRDVNYPGCTYRLNYVPETDRLQGVYFQAAMQEQYEVAFERSP
jgi:hypothetical protein